MSVDDFVVKPTYRHRCLSNHTSLLLHSSALWESEVISTQQVVWPCQAAFMDVFITPLPKLISFLAIFLLPFFTVIPFIKQCLCECNSF